MRIEQTTFSLGEYEAYLDTIASESKAAKAHQQASFRAERERWHELGLDTFVSESMPDCHEDAELHAGEDGIYAQVPGSVWKVLVEPGAVVRAGQELFVLESMKMEIPVLADEDGRITQVCIKQGERVEAGQVLAAFILADREEAAS